MPKLQKKTCVIKIILYYVFIIPWAPSEGISEAWEALGLEIFLDILRNLPRIWFMYLDNALLYHLLRTKKA